MSDQTREASPIAMRAPTDRRVADERRRTLSSVARGARARALDPESSTLLLIVVIAVVVAFWILLRDTAFMSWSNLLNIVRQTTPVTIMAVATVFVISAGEIDLSFASVPPLAGLVAATLLQDGHAVAIAITAALCIGLAVGLVNGIITVGLGIPSFIVTLGMIGVLEGLARLVSGQKAIPIVHEGFAKVFGLGDVGPFPSLLLWTVLAGILGAIALRRTPFGKAVLATGGNEAAARYSGISTGRIKITVLVISGLAGALAGLLYSGQLQSARYDLGASDLLTALAAVIIGGTALAGGRGAIVGAIAGSILLGLVNNGVVLLGFSTPEQQIFTGLIIVVAVALSSRKLTSAWRTS